MTIRLIDALRRFARNAKTPVAFAILFALAAATGCQKYEGPERAEVFGSVTWNGQPVDGGVINFVPADGSQRNASADISGGKYKVPEEVGPNLGSYKVMVNWATKTDAANPDSPMLEQIPRQFNFDSQLTATIDKSPQELNFSLPH